MDGGYVYLTFESLVHCVFRPCSSDFVKSMLRKLNTINRNVLCVYQSDRANVAVLQTLCNTPYTRLESDLPSI